MMGGYASSQLAAKQTFHSRREGKGTIPLQRQRPWMPHRSRRWQTAPRFHTPVGPMAHGRPVKDGMGRASIFQSVQWRTADESRTAWAALPYSSRSNGAWPTSQGWRGPRFHTPVGPMAHGRRVKDGVGRASILQSVQWRMADESRMAWAALPILQSVQWRMTDESRTAWAALPYSSRSNGTWPTSQGRRGPRFHTPVGPMAHGRRVNSRMAWATSPRRS